MSDKLTIQQIKKLIRLLEQQREDLDREIAKLIDADDDWQPLREASKRAGHRRNDRSTARDGSAGTGQAQSPAHRRTGRRRALQPRQRNLAWGKRTIFAGRPHVRATRYVAILSAMRFNPLIKAFADRLKAAGKPFKVIAVACIRKLLTILNFMIRDNQTWREPCLKTA